MKRIIAIYMTFGLIMFMIIGCGGGSKSDLEQPEENTTQATGNIPPIANAGDDKRVVFNGASIKIIGTDSDSDGEVVSRKWREIEGSDSTVLTLLSTEKFFEYTPTGTGIHTFEYTVTDNDGATASDKMILTLTEPEPEGTNNAPVPVQNLEFTISSCDVGSVTRFNLEANDADNDTLTYSNVRINRNGYGEVTLISPQEGTVEFTISDERAKTRCLALDQSSTVGIGFSVSDGVVTKSTSLRLLSPSRLINDGRTKYVTDCASCHGADGLRRPFSLPNATAIGEIGNKQIVKNLLNTMKIIGVGTGKNPAMINIARNLSDNDIEKLSAYIATLKQ